MAILEVHTNTKIEHKQEKKQQQEFKHIGVGRKRKGLTMYAYDYDKREIYRVKLVKKLVYDTTIKKEVASYKAIVNPKHPHIYALNMKNAVRKFARIIKTRQDELSRH